jgi:dynein heavy chain
MANRFSVIQTQIRKKPYDFLDQRKQEFAGDYDDFQRQIKELHVSFVNINAK